jgi:hypothetical protein
MNVSDGQTHNHISLYLTTYLNIAFDCINIWKKNYKNLFKYMARMRPSL